MSAARSYRLSPPVIAAIGGVVLMLAVGRAAGQDYNWDLLNYHFILPDLLLMNHTGQVLAPSGLQSWFNPLGYIPAFLAIRLLPPWLASALLAIVAGLNAPLIYRIAEIVGNGLAHELRRSCALACAAIGMTGAITLSEAGTTFLDVSLSLLVLGGLLAVLRAGERGGLAGHALGGLLLGLACGLKLTTIVLAVGLAAAGALLTVTRRLRWGAVPALAAGGCVGFLMTGGWWAWRNWRALGDPVFPLFNQLFHSPFAPATPLLDTNFLPAHWTGIVTFPWHWLIGDGAYGAELSIRDPRYAVALLASLIMLAGGWRDGRRADPGLFVAAFFLASYAAWIHLFAILRYVVVLEMLSGVVLLAALRTLPGLPPTRLPRVMTVLALSMLLATRPAMWGRAPFTADWFGVRGVGAIHRAGTLYVLSDDSPLGFMVAAFPDDASFVRIGGNFPLVPTIGLGRRAEAMIDGAARLRSLAAAPADAPIDTAALRRFGLASVSGSCRIILTKTAPIESCALARTR